MPAIFSVTYKVAPLSISREEKGELALVFSVLDHGGVIVIPMPKFFREMTWKKNIMSEDGKRVKETLERNYWNYVDSVVIEWVSKKLRELNYAPFELRICGDK
jgi:hypothetical protein